MFEDLPSSEFDFECGMEACFQVFDQNCDGVLDMAEFRTVCRTLFRNTKGDVYELKDKEFEQIFQIFDSDRNGTIDKMEFLICWNRWIKTIVRPTSALLIVDVQNDFISGTLCITNCPAGHNGEDVIEPINNLLDNVSFDSVYYSYDWHPIDHISFVENLTKRPLHPDSPLTDANVYDTVIFDGPGRPIVQKLWPKHCAQNTWGSELHERLNVLDDCIKIYKGSDAEVDCYSVFGDNEHLSETELDRELKNRNITDLYICGLAYDVCVGSTAIDAIERGYRTIVIDDCCRGVDLLDIEKTQNSIREKYGIVIDSGNVKDMVEGKDRRPELAYKLALELEKTMN